MSMPLLRRLLLSLFTQCFSVASAIMTCFISQPLIIATLLLLMVATIVCQCETKPSLRTETEIKVPINEFYCANLTRGQTWEDWKTRVVKLPKEHIDGTDSSIVVDYFVRWPWYLKGMTLTVCNSIGHRPNISWPPQGYSPVSSHCSTEDSPRCAVGLEIYMVQYQSWWPWT